MTDSAGVSGGGQSSFTDVTGFSHGGEEQNKEVGKTGKSDQSATGDTVGAGTQASTVTEGQTAATGDHTLEDLEQAAADLGTAVGEEKTASDKGRNKALDAADGTGTAARSQQGQQTAKTEKAKGDSLEVQDKSKAGQLVDDALQDLGETVDHMGNPSLDAPQGGTNVWLQTGAMVAAMIAGLTMIRNASEMREMDTATRTQLTLMASEMKQVAAELAKSAKIKEAEGQIMAASMQMAQGMMQVMGGMMQVGMGAASLGVAFKGTKAVKKDHDARVDQEKGQSNVNRNLGAQRASADSGSPDVNSQTLKDTYRGTGKDSTNKAEAEIAEFGQQAAVRNAKKGKYEVVYEENPGTGQFVKKNSADFVDGGKWDQAAFEQAIAGQDALLLPAGKSASQGGFRTEISSTASPDAQRRLEARNDAMDEVDLDVGSNYNGYQKSGKKLKKKGKDLKTTQTDLDQNAGRAANEVQRLRDLSQGMNQVGGGISQTLSGLGQSAAALGSMMDAMMKMEAAQTQYMSETARLIGELMDAHMRVVNEDIDDFRKAINEGLDVLSRLQEVAKRGASVRG